MRGLRKTSPGYALDVQGFVSDEPVRGNELSGLLVMKVSALVRHPFVQASDLLTSLAAANRAFLFPGERPLRHPELLLSLSVVARRLHGSTVGGDEKTLESQVYADGETLSRSLRRVSEVAGEHYVPFAADLLTETVLIVPATGRCSLTLT